MLASFLLKSLVFSAVEWGSRGELYSAARAGPKGGRKIADGTERARLIEVGREIWIAEGPSVSFFTIPYPTRMTIVRLSNGRLWVCSPIQLDSDLEKEVNALGSVEYVVSPNKLHHLFLGEWTNAWPGARLYASPGLARRRKGLRFNGELGDTPPAEWAGEVDQVIVHGSFALEEVLFFHRVSRTLIVTDLIQKFEPERLSRAQRLVMRLDGMLGPNGSTPREWRLSFWNRKAARQAVRKALAWNPERVVLAHGAWIRKDGRAGFERSLRWLKPT